MAAGSGWEVWWGITGGISENTPAHKISGACEGKIRWRPGRGGSQVVAKVKSVRQQVRDSITGQLLDKLGCEKLPRELEHQVKTYMGFYDRFGALESAIADFEVGGKLYLECSKELRQVAREMRSILDFLGCRPPDGHAGGYIEL